jgi:hypothetical protein
MPKEKSEKSPKEIVDLYERHYKKQGDPALAAAALNDLRRGIARHTVRINPRCVVTRAHLRHGIWNKARTS